MNVLVYAGNVHSRRVIRQKEFYYKQKKISKRQRKSALNFVAKFNVLITSYDTAINDECFMKKIKWHTLVVDEAHRLKNNSSKFFKVS